MLPFTVTIAEAEMGGELPEKLRAEWSGILAWGVRGCLKWQEKGLEVPETVKKATEEYRREMDVLGEFLEECCELGDQWVSSGELYRAYATWCHQTEAEPLRQTTFGESLSARGLTSRRRSVGSEQKRGIEYLTMRDGTQVAVKIKYA